MRDGLEALALPLIAFALLALYGAVVCLGWRIMETFTRKESADQ